VFFHHPPQDPLPSKTSQLGDRREAAELEKKLGEFRESSGKSAAVINGHVGVFHGAAVEGVSYLINGNSGKNPAGTPATGGFTGWTMLGIDPGVGEVGDNPSTADRVGWLAAETRPQVDSISVDAPSSMVAGQSADISAEFTQGDSTVPVGWPATAQWGGDGVVIDAGAEVDMQNATGTKVHAEAAGSSAPEAASEVIRINPATGEITAENPGTAVVEVTVNSKTAKTTVEVAGDGPPPGPGDDGVMRTPKGLTTEPMRTELLQPRMTVRTTTGLRQGQKTAHLLHRAPRMTAVTRRTVRAARTLKCLLAARMTATHPTMAPISPATGTVRRMTAPLRAAAPIQGRIRTVRATEAEICREPAGRCW
ncbi:MAG: hypothetical protein L0G54_17205, partial [Brevibacterium sp.]|nr:hypothetical protein [Brevibacterium sp.]